MALFSWLAKGRAARVARGVPAAAGVEAPASEARKAPEAAPRLSEAKPLGRPDSPGPKLTEGGRVPAVPLPPPPPLLIARSGAGSPPHADPPPVGLLPATRTAPSGAGVVELPLARVLECIPLLFLAGDAERLVASEAVQKARVALPLARILGQLPSGRIEFPFDELRSQIPPEFLSPEADAASRGDVLVSLDLAEVVSRVPASKMARRGDQMAGRTGPDTSVGDLIPMPFAPGTPGPVSETERIAKAVSARSVLGPLAQAVTAPPGPPAKVPPEAVIAAAEKTKPVAESPQAKLAGEEPPKPVIAEIPKPVAVEVPKPKPLFGPLPTAGFFSAAKEGIAPKPVAAPLPKAAKAAVPTPSAAAAPTEGFRPLPRARVGVTSSLLPQPAVAAPAAPAVDEKTLAARALARWLGCAPGRPILIREIPSILANIPGVAGAILSDSEALTVARELPPGLSEDAVSSSASVLFKRLRIAARELGGGFTNQTLVGLGQWTLLITYEPPFFLTTLHTTHQVGPRLDCRMRKIARALARLEAARPVVRA